MSNAIYKVLMLAVLGMITGCDSGSSVPATQTVTPETQTVPVSTPLVDPSPSPTVTPAASPTPSPSPSPSPSPTVTPYAYGGGSGTSLDPYLLDTATDVDHIADHTNASYRVTQDIDMNGHDGPRSDFSGNLNGSGKQFFNLAIVSVSGADAFFHALSGTVHDLTMNGHFLINGGTSIAAFATVFTGSILQCHVLGSLDYLGAPLNPTQSPSVVMTSSFGVGGAKLLTGSGFDVMWNGTHYTHSF